MTQRFLSCQPEIESIESTENTGGLVWPFQPACINHNERSIHWIIWFNSNILLTWKKSLSWFAHETTMRHNPICRLCSISQKKQGLSNYRNYPIQIAHWFMFTVRSKENRWPLGGPPDGQKVVLWLMCIYFTKLLPASLEALLFLEKGWLLGKLFGLSGICSLLKPRDFETMCVQSHHKQHCKGWSVVWKKLLKGMWPHLVSLWLCWVKKNTWQLIFRSFQFALQKTEVMIPAIRREPFLYYIYRNYHIYEYI